MARADFCHNVEEFRQAARARLPKWIFEFIDLGAEDFVALNHNIEAFRRLKLRGAAMGEMTGRDLSTTLFGGRVPFPLAIAPTGAAGLCWYEGEFELARAAARAGVPFTMAVGSVTRLERIAEAGGRLWLQVYIWQERELTRQLVERARASGYEALVVTADYAIGNNREYNIRNGYGNPFKPTYRTVRDIVLRPDWMVRTLFRYLATTGMPRQANNPEMARNFHNRALIGKDGAGNWDDIAKLRDLWPGKLIVKGVLRADDAERAVALGADGIVVSNHGGRGLDSAVASIDALPAIADAVKGRTTILLDGGVRRGSDILKARALGADSVLTGRATLWGVAVGGEAGAARVLDLLKREYAQTLAYVGCRTTDELSRDVLASDAALRGHGL